MEISYQLTEDDYRQGYKAFRRRKTSSLWFNRIAYACFLLVLLAALFESIIGPDRSFANLALLWGLAAFWGYCLWYAPRYASRKMIRGSPTASLPHTMDISEEGLHSRTSAGECRLTWNSFIGWLEVDRVFVLFPSPLSFFPIPKRAMSREQHDELRSIFQKKVLKKI